MKSNGERIAVIGGGSWGTALADVLARNGRDTTLWIFEQDLAAEMAANRINTLYLPGFNLHPALQCTSNLSEALADRTMILLVTPVQVMRTVLSQAAELIGHDTVIVNASKGIELKTLLPVSRICAEMLGEESLNRYVALSGPTFAREVAAGLPSLIVAASRNEKCAQRVQSAFSNPTFRAYTNNDVTGVELGGAVKNVIAIAAGICDGLGFGHNARAALITRGLAEMNRLGVAMGAQPGTFAGLAGMGDLVLTCTGDLSRNRTVGFKLGQGMRLAEILAEMHMVAEGVKTAESVYQLSRSLGVEMPIVEKAFQILHEDKPAREAVTELMARDLKAEG
ncbi:NAD(P)H-dependent glycerol-3-phosphate dehydrogenase [Pelotalea chapellei]|uniref:Glycerol-3-phosphate dehydrogenase [NAD(P)+] n=1 Tax=Pelotalea chapellei TaxID=44671 RepID=A0ABS5U4S8_9BACT|nr:NAD(P)H-dependent glycerol-3-phosphate dehydrogenase [Pelotalea chapellei]MBT1070667.1 NAD(P)-dependent glycerol-3-phosphate dehydrogenase [Pelotalea chapellei]